MKKRKQNRFHLNNRHELNYIRESVEYKLWISVIREIGYMLWNGTNNTVFYKNSESDWAPYIPTSVWEVRWSYKTP